MEASYVQGKPFFTANSKVPRQFPYLTHNTTTEVVIIGGGVTGSLIAYYFTKQGIPCVLLEKHRVAYGSTSITTALLQYELDSTIADLMQYTTKKAAISSYHLGVKALAEIDAFIKQYGNLCEYQQRDTLFYTAKEQEIPIIKEEYKNRKENGLFVDFITKENNLFSFPLAAGVYATNGGAEINPYLYTHQLLEVSLKQGLRVYENTAVEKVFYTEDGVEVITSYDYRIKGKIVIVATGYDTNLFTNRNFGTKTITYNIVTEPISKMEGWTNNVLIRDNEDPYHYLRLTKDNRIIIGGEDIPFDQGNVTRKIAEEKYQLLEQRIKMMFPQLNDIKVAYKYGGAFASTSDNLGFLGKDPKKQNLWYALGYGANGILFGVLGGMMLSQLYKGIVDKDLEYFKIDRFK